MEYYYSAMKNDILLFAATWKDYKGIILSKKSQTEKDYILSLICGILKKNTTQLIYKTNRLTDIENKLKVTRGAKGWGR